MSLPYPATSFAPVENVLMEAVAAQAVIEAARMGLFELTHGSPRTADDLARALGVLPAPLEAMLDLLAARGLLRAEDGAYANSPMTDEYLVQGSLFFQGQALELQARFNAMTSQAIPALLKGERSERQETDDGWAAPEIMEGTLQHAVNGQLQDTVDFLSALPGFGDFRTMADIGGNHGQYSMGLLDRNPDLKSTILDLPPVVEAARQRCARLGYDGRIDCRPFDLRTDQLDREGYDLILASHMLYACKRELPKVLAMVREALTPDGRFASHHFAPEGGTSAGYRTAVEFVTRLSGYDTHFLSRGELEAALLDSGFVLKAQTFTGPDKRALLLVAAKR